MYKNYGYIFFKFTLLSKYFPSLVSNPRDEISRFITGISDLDKEEFRMARLHHDINIYSLVMYGKYINLSKHELHKCEMKRSLSDEQRKPSSHKNILQRIFPYGQQ